MSNEDLFYICGIALAVSAVMISFIGLKVKDFPGKAFPIVILWFAVLVGAAATFSVLHAKDEDKAKAAEFEKAGEEFEAEGNDNAAGEARQPKAKPKAANGGEAEAEAPSGPGGTVQLEADATDLAYDTTELSSKPGKVTIDFTNPLGARTRRRDRRRRQGARRLRTRCQRRQDHRQRRTRAGHLHLLLHRARASRSRHGRDSRRQVGPWSASLPLMAKRFHVTTFGCQMNVHDSERMRGMLASLGYEEAESRTAADLILFNTCSIRESADSRFIAHLGEAKRLKGEEPERIVGVGGCWAQSVKDEVFQRFPFVDVAFGPGQIHKLAEFLNSDSLTAQGYFEFEDFSGHLPTRREREFQGWLQISQGCNCVCSYCIVPSTRGREVSRDPVELLAEAEALAADGVREVTLLGQNVNSYGRDLPRDRRTSFAELLARVDAVEGIDRIRYTSPHPKDMKEDVIRAHAELPALCEQIHLPLQSGSSSVLKRMRRTYDRRRYMDRVALIREHVPDCAITTDIIVGFPGETEADFAETLEVVEEVGYDGAFTFVFSPRRETEAATHGRPGRPPGQGRAHGAAGRGGPAARRGAGPALRRPDAGGAGRRHQPHRRDPAARPHPAQQGGQLRGRRRARRAGHGRDRQRHLADAGRGLGAARSRSSFERPRHLRAHRRRQDRGGDRAGGVAAGAAARTRWRSPATRCRSTRGSGC